jgi:hypothetical protein
MKGRKTLRTAATQMTWRKTFFLLCSMGALVAFFAFAGGASAMRETASSAPSIVSDQPDYNPGATVTLAGANWGADEVVHVVVNDSNQEPWSYSNDVTADANGNFTIQFQLPTSFSASYAVQATGSSGAIATTSFTDGNVNIKTSGVSSAPVNWVLRNSTNCSGPSAASGSITADDQGNGVSIAGGASATQSLTLTAGSVSGFTFASWSGGNVPSPPNSSNPICVPGQGPTQQITLTYTGVTDTSPPVITANVVGTQGNNSWYTSNVAVSWSVTDGQSTITSTSGCGTSNVTTDTTGVTFTCSATSAGGSNSQSVTVKRDATAPTNIVLSFGRPFDNADWYNHAVLISASGTDVTSGIASCQSSSYSSPDSATASATRSCTDNAGNSASGSVGFKYDETGPTAALAVTAGTAGDNGWYTSDVTVSTSGADAVSGVSCTVDQHQTAETGGQAFNGSCTNGAGLTTNATALSVKLDKTGPSATLSASGTVGDNGWYTSDVTISASGTDSISSPVTCSLDQHQTTDTTGADFNGSCKNNAGLTTNATQLTVKRDATAPTITNQGPSPASPNGNNSWYITAISNAFKASDSTSGLSGACAAAFPLSSGDHVKNVSSLAQEGLNVKVQSGTCADDAGNVASSIDSVAFKIDLTNPVVTCPAVPTFLASQLPMTITAAVTDSPSGPASTTATGTANSPSGGTVNITGQDNAGRSGSALCAYHVGNTTFLSPIDKAPTMNIAKLGRVVPVKATLVHDGNPVTLTGNVYVGGLSNADCATGAVADEIEVYAAAGASNTGNLFRWDSSGPFWIYNFDTSAFKLNPANCYRINVYYGGSATNGIGSGGALVGYFLMRTTK